MAEKALTIRVDEDLARQLAIHRALTDEPTNALVVRLLNEYLLGDGVRALTSLAFDRVEKQYQVALDKLA